MAIIKAISSHAPIGTVLDYVTKKEKVSERLVSGIECSPQTAKEEMQATKELYGKTGGRTYKHFVQSFAPGEDITHEQAHEIAVKLASNTEVFEGYEVLVATHRDKDHIHSHFVVNSVSYEDGHKFQMTSQDLQKLKDQSDVLCREYGLTVCEKGIGFDGFSREGIVAWTKEKYQYLKSVFEEKTSKSYLCDIRDSVQHAMEKACSIEDFKAYLSEDGISVKWKDSRKNITYTNSDGKSVRDTNLRKTFNLEADKESLMRKFEENKMRSVPDREKILQKDILISKYTVSTYSEMQDTLCERIKEQRRVMDIIKQKCELAEQSIKNLQSDIQKWTAQKNSCSTVQFTKKYQLQEKIEHGKTLLESIKADKENCMSQYGVTSLDDIAVMEEDLQQAEELSVKIQESIETEQKNLQEYWEEYGDIESSGGEEFSTLEEDVMQSAREELQKTFASDYSEARFQQVAQDTMRQTTLEREIELSMGNERRR